MLSGWRNTFQTVSFDRYAGVCGAATTVVCLVVGAVSDLFFLRFTCCDRRRACS